MHKETTTILCVDDEPSILKSLKRQLSFEGWNLLFAESAADGLRMLEEQNIDLILSDVRMPAMDGIEFLGRVREIKPSIIRIILTGFAQTNSVTKALSEGIAQQIILKPWNDKELIEVIHNALRQSRLQRNSSSKLQTLINSVPLLPPLPASYQEIRKCFANKDDLNIDRVADIISHDIGLSSMLLHWSNSALFGQRRKVTTVKRAIVLLGIDIVENLILSETLSKTLGAKDMIGGLDLKAFQAHSMACAIIARILSKDLPHANAELADQAFIAGLLHDIGKLAEADFFTDKFSQALNQATKNACLLHEAEQEIFASTHTEIGSLLAEWWELPEFIVNSIRWHHAPESAPTDQILVKLVQVANLLAQNLSVGFSGNGCMPELDSIDLRSFDINQEQQEQLRIEVETNLISN